MKIDFNDMLYALSYALDCVEHELIGVTTHHSKRVAYICALVGQELNFTDKQLRDVTACAVLHDSALTEYIKYECLRGVNVVEQADRINPEMHCSMGEANMRLLPLDEECENAVLYHHENADGSGPFHKHFLETPIYAQLIRLGDKLDADFNLGVMDEEKFEMLLDFVKNATGSFFSKECVDAFVKRFDYETAFAMQSEKLDLLLGEMLPNYSRDLSRQQILNMATMFAQIIDYKSEFTGRHSMGIAQKAMDMARYYNYDEDTVTQIYLAGALHDLGKLVVKKDVLEKPDQLTDEEYKHIQNHAYYTYAILHPIKGLEDITMWASLHHEKLDGTGYPFGKKANELNKLERLIACLDIYQALTEERPYKRGMSHSEAMQIINEMVDKNQLDKEIVADIDLVYGEPVPAH